MQTQLYNTQAQDTVNNYRHGIEFINENYKHFNIIIYILGVNKMLLIISPGALLFMISAMRARNCNVSLDGDYFLLMFVLRLFCFYAHFSEIL